MPVVVTPFPTLWYNLRRSRTLVVVVVFIAMTLDLITLTTLEPILPDILYRMEHNVSYVHNQTLVDSGDNTAPVANVTTTTHKAGIILATKPGTEIIANIIVGSVVQRFGHKYPMIIGCWANIVATLGFAYSWNWYMLVVSRAVQAIGSSLSVVSGLSLLATVFTDDEERTRVNGIAFGGLSLGIIIGFPFGSITYQFLGRSAPFIILSALMLIDATLRWVIVTRNEETENVCKESGQMCELLLDPYISIALGLNFVQHISLGMVITTEAAWMLEKLHAQQWQIGMVLVVAAIFQFASQFLTATYSVSLGRWVFCVLGPLFSSAGYAMFPLCESVWHVIGPETVSRIGLGIILSVLSPLLAHIVDTRHHSDYGAIYGLYAASYNMGLVVGPVCGGLLLHTVGFDWLYRGTAAILFIYALLCFMFRRLEMKDGAYTPVPVSESDYGTFLHKSDLHASCSIEKPSPANIRPVRLTSSQSC